MTRVPFLGLVTLAAALMGCANTLAIDAPPPIPGFRLSHEEQINAVLSDVRRGMETRQIYRVLAHVSPNYRDGNNHTYEDLAPRFNAFFDRYRNIRIRRARPRIFVLGDYAHAMETFATIADPADPLVDSPLNIEGNVLVYFERAGNRWMITSWEHP